MMWSLYTAKKKKKMPMKTYTEIAKKDVSHWKPLPTLKTQVADPKLNTKIEHKY